MHARKLSAVLAVAFAAVLGLTLDRPAAAGDPTPKQKAEQAIKDGDQALILGDVSAARTKFGEAVQADPKNATAVMRLAFAETQAGNDAEAVKLLEELTSRDASAPSEAWLILGGALHRRRELAKAAAAYETYLGKQKNDVQARMELARVYKALSEEGSAEAKQKALDEYERVKQASKDDEATFRAAEEEVFGLKYGAAGKLFREGKDAFASGDVKAAVSKLEGVVKQYPEIEEAHYLLGLAYVTPDLGRRADAMRSWEKAPSIKEAQLQLGIELINDGDLKNAEDRLRKAVTLDARYQEAWYHLGVIAAERGDEKAAAAAWEEAMDVDPNSETGKWARTKWQLITARTTGEFQEGQIIDPALETELGQKFAEQVLQDWPEVKDAKLVARMEGIFDKLVDATQRDDLEYTLYVVDAQMWGQPLVNAFAFPGGRIFITKALIDGIKMRFGDRDEYYAAILGHELAHAALRHVPERWKLMQTMVNAPDMSTQDLYGVLGNLGTGMTRQSEYEADRYGTLYMYRAGYNPKYMHEFWNNASKVLPDTPPGMDHATHKERAARTRDFLIEMRGRVSEFERGNKALEEEDYATAARHYEVFLALLPKNAPGHMNLALARHRQALARVGAQTWKRSTDLDPDSRAAAVEVHSADKKMDPRIDKRLLKQAAAEYKTALRLDPTYTLARVNYGALLVDLGQTKVARKVLEQAVKVAPKNAMAWNNLGVAYIEGANKKKAIEAFQKAVTLDAKLADPWFNLAGIYEQAGNLEQAIAALDEYTKRDAASGWAKAARARKAELAQRPKNPKKTK
jgi:predicted Zn-dependent protease